jgi:GDP-mannose 6-dehydrogenase
LLTENLEKLVADSDVIVVSNKEKDFQDILKDVKGKIIVDMVRLDASIKDANTYIGINW